MAIKKVFANYLGRLKELASGDYVLPNQLGSGTPDSTKFLRGDSSWATPSATVTITQTEVDFGTTPVYDAVFTITDAAASATSKITATVAYDAPTGKDLDELEMDDLIIRCGNASTGQFQIFIREAEGSYLHDKFKINYIIS